MIYTVTFNPAIDYVVHTEGMRLGAVNRSISEKMFFGGKGINVSLVLRELGVESRALGFVAGFTGEAIEKGLGELGLETDFVKLGSGNSRINVKIKGAEETELNGQGPDIDYAAQAELYWKLDRLAPGDTLVLAGSVPDSLPRDIYERILDRLADRDIRAVVDATGDLLMNTLRFRPFLIKPNDQELGEIFCEDIRTTEQVEHYARKLRELGARNVLVSRAGDGALLVDENGVTHVCGACQGTVKNSVGAGDSMVAGFLAGADRGYDEALKLGTAAGGATAFSEGLASRELIARLRGTL